MAAMTIEKRQNRDGTEYDVEVLPSPADVALAKREEEVWTLAFCAALAAPTTVEEWNDLEDEDGDIPEGIEGRAVLAGARADASLAEWRKRWGK